MNLEGKEQNIGAGKIKNSRTKNKTTSLEQRINKEERKEKRNAHEDGRRMDDLATRSVECS